MPRMVSSQAGQAARCSSMPSARFFGQRAQDIAREFLAVGMH